MPRLDPSALPNIITVARILVTPAIFALTFARGFWPGMLNFVLFLAAAISDLWDGHLARKNNWVSDFGKFWDPVADKLLVIVTFIPFYILSHRPGTVGDLPYLGELPGWILLVVFGREVIVTAIRSVAARRGVVIPAGSAGKRKAVFQNIFVGSVLFWYAIQDGARAHGWSGDMFAALEIFNTIVCIVSLTIAVVLTVWSMGVYLWNWRTLMRRISV